MALVAELSPSRDVSTLHRQKPLPLPGRRNISTLSVPGLGDPSALHRHNHPPSSRTNPLILLLTANREGGSAQGGRFCGVSGGIIALP